MLLERQGVVLPQKPEELPEVLQEHQDLKDEILLWATFAFGLPFADLSFTSPILNLDTKYEERLRKAQRILKGGQDDDE